MVPRQSRSCDFQPESFMNASSSICVLFKYLQKLTLIKSDSRNILEYPKFIEAYKNYLHVIVSVFAPVTSNMKDHVAYIASLANCITREHYVIFQPDAEKVVGFGHVVSCLAPAGACDSTTEQNKIIIHSVNSSNEPDNANITDALSLIKTNEGVFPTQTFQVLSCKKNTSRCKNKVKQEYESSSDDCMRSYDKCNNRAY